MDGYTPKQYEVILDRYQRIGNKTPEFTQYDTQSSKLEFSFLENGVPFDIPYTRLVLVIQKPDKKEVYQEIESFSGNTAEVILKNQALTVAGELNCQIKMYKNEILESTWPFKIKVKPSIGNEDAIESTDEYQVLQQLFIDVDSKKDEMEQTITENINHNNNATQQMINAMKVATDEAIKSIDESAVGVLNQQVLDSNYQTFTTTGFMSRVGENKVATPSHLMETLELGDEDYEQLELLETPSTLEEPMEEFNPNEGIMLIPEIEAISNHEVVPIESGIARSAILRGQTLVNIAPIYYGAGNVKLSDEVTIKANVENAVANYRVKWFRPIHSLKPNTKYLIKFDITELNNIVGLSSYLKYDTGEYTYGIFQGLTSVGRYSIPFTTDSRNCTEIAIYIQKSDDETIYAKIKGVMVFEYVEGMETWDIPYFTGMQSVRMPVLRTTGKNMVNILDFTEQYSNGYYYDNPSTLLSKKVYIDYDGQITLSCKGYSKNVTNGRFRFVYTNGTAKDCTFLNSSDENNPVIIANKSEAGKKVDYITFTFSSIDSNPIVYFKELQVEESTEPTSYEPYKSNILSTPEDLELCGIAEVQDTLDCLTGELTKRIYKIVFDESFKDRSILVEEFENVYRFGVDVTHISNNLSNDYVMKSMCDKFNIDTNYTGDYEHAYYWGATFYFFIAKNKLQGTASSFKAYITDNPIVLQTIYAEPVHKTVELSGVPFFFKDGHILLSSASEEPSLLPTLEYTVPTNLRGQAENNAESILSLEKEKVDVKSVDVEATANTIVKRNEDGNIHTKSAIEFETAGLKQKHPLQVIDDAHITIGNRRVWDDGNLPIESGKWTPHLSGLSANISRHYGEYCRQGHLVYLYMEFESTQWVNHGHDVIFSGLPFASNQETPFSVEMIKGVVESTQDDYHRNIFGLVSGTTLKLYKRGLNGTWWETLKSYHGVHDHFIIRIAVTYRTA